MNLFTVINLFYVKFSYLKITNVPEVCTTLLQCWYCIVLLRLSSMLQLKIILFTVSGVYPSEKTWPDGKNFFFRQTIFPVHAVLYFYTRSQRTYVRHMQRYTTFVNYSLHILLRLFSRNTERKSRLRPQCLCHLEIRYNSTLRGVQSLGLQYFYTECQLLSPHLSSEKS